MLEMMMFLFLYKVTAGRPFWRVVALCGVTTFLIVVAWWFCHLWVFKLGFLQAPPI